MISAYYNDINYDWFKPGDDIYDVLKMCTKTYLIAKFGSDDSLKIAGSPMIMNITQHIKDKINSVLQPDKFTDDQKYVLYTGH